MKKWIYFLPAAVFTVWTLCLNVLTARLIPMWHLWNVLFWVSGYLMSRGRAWGFVLGLLPGAMILFFVPDQPVSVERMVALTLTVYYLACGAWLIQKKYGGHSNERN